MVLRAEMLELRAPKLYSVSFFQGHSGAAIHVRFSLRAWTLVTAHAEQRGVVLGNVSRRDDAVTLVIPLGAVGPSLRALVFAVESLTMLETLEAWCGEGGSQLVWIDALSLRGGCGMTVVLTPEMTAFVRSAPADVFTRINERFHFAAACIAGELSSVYGVFRENGALRIALGMDCACLGTNHAEQGDVALVLHSHNVHSTHLRLALAAFGALEDEYRERVQ